jgi:hypothetical protein
MLSSHEPSGRQRLETAVVRARPTEGSLQKSHTHAKAAVGRSPPVSHPDLGNRPNAATTPTAGTVAGQPKQRRRGCRNGHHRAAETGQRQPRERRRPCAPRGQCRSSGTAPSAPDRCDRRVANPITRRAPLQRTKRSREARCRIAWREVHGAWLADGTRGTPSTP